MQLEHIEEMLQEDFQESITEIIAPEHIKIVAKMLYKKEAERNGFFLFIIRITFLKSHQ